MLDPQLYTIRLASPSQIEAHVQASFEIDEWRNAMTWEEFQVFYGKEHASEWAKDSGALTWVLVRRDDYDGQIYSTCITHRIKCFYKSINSKSKSKSNSNSTSNSDPNDGGIVTISNEWYYTVTTVATPIRRRGKGYAKHLIQLLHYVLLSPSDPGHPISDDIPEYPVDKWGEPPLPISEDILPKGIASVLWSDLPIKFYENCKIGSDKRKSYGWKSRAEWNYRLTWSLNSNRDSCSSTFKDKDDDSPNLGWDPIWESDLFEIGSILSQSIKHKLENIDTYNQAILVQDPSSRGLLSFVRSRGSFLPDRLAVKPSSSTQGDIPWGLRLKKSSNSREHSGESEETIVIFALDNYQISPNLLMTYIHNLQPYHLNSLLSALDRIVSTSGIGDSKRYGEVWGLDPQSELVKKWKECGRDVEVGVREDGDHILGVCGYVQRELDIGQSQMWSWV
ncbi:uncharacterized protein L199_000149 [Kwoniella botswanensis]|uniref:uncharacterized protein n=1 Tax=Kwoniella botswanensis TaxID=1268659 RepID=UPI00315C5E5C